MMTLCTLCKQFFPGLSFKAHKCNMYAISWGDGVWKENTRLGRNVEGKAEEVARNYLSHKHELETWKGERGGEFERLRNKTRRYRNIVFALLEGKSMKKAKKEVFR